MFKQLIESFIRTEECRTKCGDDGKDDIIPSTDFDSIDEITLVYRACGCKMGACAPRTTKHKTYDPDCYSLEYYFIEKLEFHVVCRDCKDVYMGRRHSYQSLPFEFKQEHVPFDNMYPGQKDARWEDSISEDLSPRQIWYELFLPQCPPRTFLNPDAHALYLLKCSQRGCENPFYTFHHDCDECGCKCDDTMETGFIENDDDSALESDMEYFRQINNVTPIDKMITPTFLNSHITDSELRMRVREYESDYRQLTPERRSDFDLRLEQSFLEYNGYF